MTLDKIRASHPETPVQTDEEKARVKKLAELGVPTIAEWTGTTTERNGVTELHSDRIGEAQKTLQILAAYPRHGTVAPDLPLSDLIGAARREAEQMARLKNVIGEAKNVWHITQSVRGYDLDQMAADIDGFLAHANDPKMGVDALAAQAEKVRSLPQLRTQVYRMINQGGIEKMIAKLLGERKKPVMTEDELSARAKVTFGVLEKIVIDAIDSVRDAGNLAEDKVVQIEQVLQGEFDFLKLEFPKMALGEPHRFTTDEETMTDGLQARVFKAINGSASMHGFKF